MAGKSEIVERVAARTAGDGGTRAQASAAVDAVLAEITAALVAGERVTLTGFGTFEPVPRPERSARNPRTGAAVTVAATTVTRFRAGAGLRAAVAGHGPAPLTGAAAQGAPDAPAGTPADRTVTAGASGEETGTGTNADRKAARATSGTKADRKAAAKAEKADRKIAAANAGKKADRKIATAKVEKADRKAAAAKAGKKAGARKGGKAATTTSSRVKASR